MARPVPSRRRRLAVVVAFIVGVVATAATSSSYPTIKVTPATGDFTLDPSHPAAVSRIVFKANAEATTGSPRYDVSVRLERLVTGAPIDPAQVRVIATLSPPAETPSAAASASPSLGTSGSGTPGGGAWQADLTSTYSAELPIDCGDGPCERTYWVLAALTGDAGSAMTFGWTVDGTLGWSSSAAPADAAAGVTIDPPIALAGPASGLTASTDAETIQFALDRPTAARVVEVTADAATIRTDGGSTAALTIDAKRGANPDATGSADYHGGLVVSVFPLDGPLAVAGGGGTAFASGVAGSPNAGPQSPLAGSLAPPAALPPGADPFAGCSAGRACTRRFLVSLALSRGPGYVPVDTSKKAFPFEWRLTLRRTDLIRAWASPGVMTARVIRRFDIAAGQVPVTAHLEGDMVAVLNAQPTPVHAVMETSTTSADPLAGLLPVPAAMTLKVTLPAAWPDPKGTMVSVRVQLPGNEGATFDGQPADGMIVVPGNPVVASTPCRVGTECAELWIDVRTLGKPTAELSYHWSLDIVGYSYADVPVTVTAHPVVP